jgi:hypothetical protein
MRCRFLYFLKPPFQWLLCPAERDYSFALLRGAMFDSVV